MGMKTPHFFEFLNKNYGFVLLIENKEQIKWKEKSVEFHWLEFSLRFVQAAAFFAARFSWRLDFFSSGVFRSARTLRVWTLPICCRPTCTRPCVLPNWSREMFFFGVGFSCFGCLRANLYKSSDAILVRRTEKSMRGPISETSMRGVFKPDFFSAILYERIKIWLSSVNVKLSTCSTPCNRIAFTVSRWNASMNNDFNRRISSVCAHFGPLNVKHGLTQVPIFSLWNSDIALYSLMPNSTISSSSCSNKRPNTKLSGRFFDDDPNINRLQSFLSTKNCNELVSSNGVISLLRVSFLHSGFFNW